MKWSLKLGLYGHTNGNTKVWRRKSFKDVYQVTEIVADSAGVGQMTSLNGLGWRSMKWLQQRKIVITGKGYYAPPILLMGKALNNGDVDNWRFFVAKRCILPKTVWTRKPSWCWHTRETQKRKKFLHFEDITSSSQVGNPVFIVIKFLIQITSTYNNS